jgi:NADPH-dependent curcumin reductase CurA
LKELKLDGAINYKDKKQSLYTQLKNVCPKGIDCYFDNVGEEMLDDVLS